MGTEYTAAVLFMFMEDEHPSIKHYCKSGTYNTTSVGLQSPLLMFQSCLSDENAQTGEAFHRAGRRNASKRGSSHGSAATIVARCFYAHHHAVQIWDTLGGGGIKRSS